MKRLLAVFLSVFFVCTSLQPAFAADPALRGSSILRCAPHLPARPVATEQTFIDVPSSHENFEAIAVLSAGGVIGGCPDGSFKPESAVATAEFADILRRAFANAGRTEAAAISEPLGSAPDAPVTYEGVFKAVVSALGYGSTVIEGKGGDPDGYLAIASDLNLDHNVLFRAFGPYSEETTPLHDGRLSRTYAEALATRESVAQILYNIDFELLARADGILAEILRPGMDEAAKVKSVHDYLVSHARYDHENYANNTLTGESFTARGLMVNGVGVCSAYAEATNLLLGLAGVASVEVSGVAGDANNVGNHAWNLVRIDGAYYHLDVTWDDPSPDKGYSDYRYFAVSDKTMARDHAWDKSKYPVSERDLDAGAERGSFSALRASASANLLGAGASAFPGVLALAAIVALYCWGFANGGFRRLRASLSSARK
jgi:hypothetical protein